MRRKGKVHETTINWKRESRPGKVLLESGKAFEIDWLRLAWRLSSFDPL
jgi:hypothetical protein